VHGEKRGNEDHVEKGGGGKRGLMMFAENNQDKSGKTEVTSTQFRAA
jgi:hypothetical protein